MKKLLVVLPLTLLISSACTKDWKCECTYTSGNSSWTVNSTVEDATKDEAKSECNDSGSVGGTAYNCELQR